MAAWQNEVPVAGALSRRILDEPIVLFRDREGAAKALLDRCPHRFAPLSKGAVRDGLLTCAYHGLAFNGAGKCAVNPHGPALNSMAVKTYPTTEAYKAIWIWMGDPRLADRAMLPDLTFLDQAPDTAFSSGYVCGNGNYQLFVDNILDLTHADFLHPDTLGGGSFTRTRAAVKDDKSSVSIRWDCENEVPFPLVAKALKNEDARVDSWTEVHWYPPSIMTLRSGAVPTGTDRSAGGSFLNLHIMTPESSQRTHYFFAATRDFSLEDTQLNTAYAETRARIFATEDKPMIEAQQSRVGDEDFWDLNPILLRIDEGAVRVRRKLADMIRAESADDAPGPSSRQ
ncbi:MAG TPA: aromatic ring-hydroxylating dioxygenase subunit alpha [Steroidobacteraceae bacterium]|nr:aromatic ring-hydroxylating dioxygenase subunit alpha [Steroidobacteraceae bacterium]